MDPLEIFNAVLALLFVLGLIGGLAWLLRRAGAVSMIRRPGNAGRSKRLAVIESRAVGARHRLVLVRLDDREHLLLLGPSGDLAIESGIPVKSGAASQETER